MRVPAFFIPARTFPRPLESARGAAGSRTERQVAAVGPDPWADKTTSPPSRRPSRRQQRRRSTGAPGRLETTAATTERSSVGCSKGRGLDTTFGPTRGAFRWARRARQKAVVAGSLAAGEPIFMMPGWALFTKLGPRGSTSLRPPSRRGGWSRRPAQGRRPRCRRRLRHRGPRRPSRTCRGQAGCRRRRW